MVSWTVAYLNMVLMLLIGIYAGFRIGMLRYRLQRLELIRRWRYERRKHRQRNPWVKKRVDQNRPYLYRPFPWVRVVKNQYELPDHVFPQEHQSAETELNRIRADVQINLAKSR